MNQMLKWSLPDQELCSLLVPTDLTKGNCTRPIAMGLLDASLSSSRSSCGYLSHLDTSLCSKVFCICRLCLLPCLFCGSTCSHCCTLKPWGLASCGLASGLFGSCHDDDFMPVTILVCFPLGGRVASPTSLVECSVLVVTYIHKRLATRSLGAKSSEGMEKFFPPTHNDLAPREVSRWKKILITYVCRKNTNT